MDAYVDEEVEEENVKNVIDAVTAGKTEEVFPVGEGVEREVIGGNIISHESYKITSGVGHVEVYTEVLQQVINTIMDCCSESSDDAETDELPQFRVTREQSLECFFYVSKECQWMSRSEIM